MLTTFDNWLNKVTMYRLVLYCLIFLSLAAFGLSVLGKLQYSLLPLASSLGLLLVVGFGLRIILERAYKLPANFESTLITIFILFFVLAVPGDLKTYLGLFVGLLVALVSKYVINFRGAHVFNPAALGATAAVLLQLTGATWWIGTPVLLPFVVVTGILILRKTRQFSLFFVFALVALGTLFIRGGIDPVQVIGSYPLVFLGTIMLTEPATMPSSRWLKLLYGVIVGVVFGAQTHIGPLASEPQVALVVGNIFAFLVTLRTGHVLRLVKQTKLSQTTYEFAFESSSKIKFTAGQYFAWTLGKVSFDSRGNRRNFTIASSPHEDQVKIGIKFYEPSSEFKKTLLSLKSGSTIHASALSGEFVLPSDANKKLLFMAGGIGITPFRSMIKDLSLNKQKRDIVLFYFANEPSEILYKNVWDQAKSYGVKLVALTNKERLDETLLKKHVPDYKDRACYLSGPPPMVRGYEKTLRSLGVSLSAIKSDYFSGY